MDKEELHKAKITARRLSIKETEVRLEQALASGQGSLASACISLIEAYQEALDELLQSE